MTDQLLNNFFKGAKTVTLGRFELPDGSNVRFGLRYARSFGTKPTIEGKSGRGGGFDGDHWKLGELLYHEYSQFGELRDGITLVLNDGERYDAERLKTLAADFQKDGAE